MAELRNLPDVGTSHLAWAMSMELAYGNVHRAVQLARRLLDRSTGYDSRLRAALVLGTSGARDEAEAIANEMAATNPEHTLIISVLIPIVRAGIELGCEQPSRAIEQLVVVSPYELGFIAAFIPIYLRAYSYLKLGSGFDAAEQFQRILDHRGTDPFSPFHAVAPLGVARAHAMVGNVAASVEAYERFLTNWGGADADVPVLRDAREERRRLTPGTR
jgi:eukaryotic-like serine/threonine-protein kinase